MTADYTINSNMILSGTANKSETVGATSTLILQAQPRAVLSIRNTSAGGQIVTIVQGNQAAVAGEGVVLSPGQTWIDSDQAGYLCWSGQVQAIADGAGATLSIFERGRGE